ncbi:hypothetical protein FGO68_gene3649 [Halteria grandinella]|uniref:Uncharacterized protein n=1 Tax=Halteria grandinella TaxID=5974 RepID=A0A8J8NKA9_HALGN|nr:hypothetical protein FGO68_gene3649 [Halteria grandinella]
MLPQLEWKAPKFGDEHGIFIHYLNGFYKCRCFLHISMSIGKVSQSMHLVLGFIREVERQLHQFGSQIQCCMRCLATSSQRFQSIIYLFYDQTPLPPFIIKVDFAGTQETVNRLRDQLNYSNLIVLSGSAHVLLRYHFRFQMVPRR